LTYSILIVICSLLIILLGSALFTNGIEWVGKHFSLSKEATGSVLAAVGTALPETLIPVIAILLGSDTAKKEIGIGAILGAPFMLSTLTLPLVGFWVYYFSRRGKRSNRIDINVDEIQIDLTFFLISFSLAITASIVGNKLIHYLIGFFLFWLYYYYLKIVFKRPGTVHLDLDSLYFQKNAPRPNLIIIGTQTLSGIGIMIVGAFLFIEGIERIADLYHVSPLVLSLLITPIATELPEKFNGLIWIIKKKDHLALSNVTGAMVFQSTFPVSVGLFGTTWSIDNNGTINIYLTLITSLYFLFVLIIKKKWEPVHLMGGSLAYFGYLLILLFYR